MDMDPYTVLGVDQSASDQDIKSAFRKLAVKYHPDRGGDENKFKEINEAYDKIKTQEKRQQYEASKHFGGDGFNFNFQQGDAFDMQDIFSQFFGGDPFSRNRRQYNRNPKNKNLQVNLEISLEEAYKGVKKILKLDQLEKEVSVDIPQGIDTGQTIRYKGLGSSSIKNQPPGDLLIKVYVSPHSRFQRKRLDIHHEASINCFTAITGGYVDVPTIDGKSIKLKIPEGTQPGTTMRITNHGMRQGSYVGDFFIHVNVSIPKNLKDKDKNDIQRIAESYS